MNEDDKNGSKLGTSISLVLAACFLAIIVAATIKLIQWMF